MKFVGTKLAIVSTAALLTSAFSIVMAGNVNALVLIKNSGDGPNYGCPSPLNSAPLQLKHKLDPKHPSACGFIMIHCPTGKSKWVPCTNWDNPTIGFLYPTNWELGKNGLMWYDPNGGARPMTADETKAHTQLHS
jgi:hypothetical protein